MRTRRLITLLVAATAPSSSSCFDDGVPPGATVLCASDDDCTGGKSCDRSVHVCAGPGDDVTGPLVLEARFEPAAVAQGPVALVLTADEAPVGAAVLEWAGADPGFSADTLSLADAAALAEGFYPLTAVTLTDGGGNVRRSAVDVSLKVDRTSPQIDGLVVVAGVNGVASELPGSNEITATFRVSESGIRAEDVDADLASLGLSCAALGGVLAFTCSGTIDSALVLGGVNTLVIDVRDPAGNVGSAFASVSVDLAAPTVVAGAVEIEIDGDPNRAFAASASVVVLRFLVDEDLDVDPSVTFSGGQGIVFGDTVRAQRFYTMSAIIPASPIPGIYSIEAQLTDVLGHSGTVVVPLPEPHALGVEIVDIPPSQCTIVPRADGNTCTDFDGDGFFGPSIACTSAQSAVIDCDDDDPFTHPGAVFDIFDDDKRNDCTGAPVPVPNAIYVDVTSGDDTNGGSQPFPVGSIVRAQELFAERGFDDASAAIVLATGSYTVPQGTQLSRNLYGGYDPVTWTRPDPTAVSVVSQSGADGPDLAGLVLADIDLRLFNSVVKAPTWLRNAIIDVTQGVDIDAPTLAVGPVFRRGTRINASGSGTRFIDGSAAAVLVIGGSVFFERMRITSSVDVDLNGSLTLVNSLVDNPLATDEVLECDGCAAIRVFHSHLVGASAPIGVVVNDVQPSAIVIVGSNLSLGLGATSIVLGEAGHLTAVGNTFDQTGGALLLSRSATVAVYDAGGLITFDACQWSGCDLAAENVLADVSYQSDGFHILEDAFGTSPVRGRLVDAVEHGAPTVVARDIDGACRYADGRVDTGADELP